MLFVCISDVNECTEDSDNCAQNCKNTIGSYQCYCSDGYALDSDDLHTCNGMCNDNQTGTERNLQFVHFNLQLWLTHNA